MITCCHEHQSNKRTLPAPIQTTLRDSSSCISLSSRTVDIVILLGADTWLGHYASDVKAVNMSWHNLELHERTELGLSRFSHFISTKDRYPESKEFSGERQAEALVATLRFQFSSCSWIGSSGNSSAPGSGAVRRLLAFELKAVERIKRLWRLES